MHTLRPFDSSGCFWLLSATLTFLVSTGKLNLYEEWIQTSKSRIENVVLLRHIKVGSPEPKTLMQSTYSKWYESTRCLLFLNKNQQPSDSCMIYTVYIYIRQVIQNSAIQNVLLAFFPVYQIRLMELSSSKLKIKVQTRGFPLLVKLDMKGSSTSVLSTNGKAARTPLASEEGTSKKWRKLLARSSFNTGLARRDKNINS